MVRVSRPAEERSMNVYDHSGVRIGTADPTGAVFDHSGVRIGTVSPDGRVTDSSGVRIGRVDDAG
jgi:sporulation protein YlmC with PRC-barrel domain